METLSKDVLVLLAMELDYFTILKFCSASKKINMYVYKNNDFWRNKLAKDFPNFKNRENRNDREQYAFLNRILTRERFAKILGKPDIATEKLGIGIEDITDVYDLLYNEYSDHSWGVIIWKKDYFEMLSINPNYEMPKDLEYIMEDQDFLLGKSESHKEGQIGRMRDFLNKVKYEDIEEENDGFRSFNFNSLITTEKRLQKYIINNTNDDVREEIKRFQSSSIGDYMDESLYNDEEIEFLQILHDGIKSEKLSIFDPADYDLLMNKFRSRV